MRDAAVAFYQTVTAQPSEPPIGERKFQFTVSVYDKVFGAPGVTVVGHDLGDDTDEGWPPAQAIRDPITGSARIYYRGQIRTATEDEVRGMEPAAVWDLPHLIGRLTRENPES